MYIIIMCVCKYIIYNNNNISMFISTGKQFQQKQAWLLTQIKTLLIIQQTLGPKTLYYRSLIMPISSVILKELLYMCHSFLPLEIRTD